MRYPYKSTLDFYGREQLVEMTPQEYEERLQWYRNKIRQLENSGNRRDKEYCSYLKRWFSDGVCDGVSDCETRIRWHQLPMTETVYFFG